MGLNTTHNAFDGGYSSFNRFRGAIAKASGISSLNMMDGYGGPKPWDTDTNLYPLLYHSDCDGELTVAECIKTRNGLEAIKDSPVLDEWCKEKVQIFIDGCTSAINANEPIIFG